MVKRNSISQEIVKEYFTYEDGDLIWIKMPSNYTKHKLGDIAGIHTQDKKQYNTVYILGKCYKTHRLIFLYHHGYLPDFIDHKDGNKHNNKIENLRECTLSENNLNSKISKNNTSGVKGVRWKRDKNKWVAYVYYNGRQKFVGYFDTIDDAKTAIEQFRKFYHGEFANNG